MLRNAPPPTGRVATPHRGDEDTGRDPSPFGETTVATPHRGDEDPRVKPQVTAGQHPRFKADFQQTSGRAIEPGESLKTAPQAHCAPSAATLSKAYP